jgi:HK97 family phage major capsid protein
MTVIQNATRLRTIQRANAFAQLAGCLLVAKGDLGHAEKLFEHRHPRSIHLRTIKAAVAAGSTSDSAWASIAPLGQIAQGFIDYLRPLTIIGRLSGYRKLPFRVKAPKATAATDATWVGESKPTSASLMGFDTTTFKEFKMSRIVGFTKELAHASTPDATGIICDDLTAAVVQASDQSFIDPTIDEIAGVRPASIAFGAPSVASTGNFATDFKALLGLVSTNLTSPFLIMKPTTAVALAAIESQLTRNVGVNGGDIGGIPVLVSANAPVDDDNPADSIIVLIDAAEIFLNEGGIELDATDRATIEMSTSASDPVTASTVLTSLWQQNLLAVKIVRFLNWQRRREGAVAYLTGVAY